MRPAGTLKLVLLFALAYAGLGLNMPPALASCSSSAGPGVDWQDCRKRNLIMTDFDFSGANFSRADLSSSDLRRTQLNGANLEKTALDRASLSGVSAKGASFKRANAPRADFSGAKLQMTNFLKAELGRTDFRAANLTGANLSKTNLSRADFGNTVLDDVRMDYAVIARSDLRSAKLGGNISMLGAYLYRTRLEGVDISSISGLKQWQIDLACGDALTTLPAGLVKPAKWPCKEELDE